MCKYYLLTIMILLTGCNPKTRKEIIPNEIYDVGLFMKCVVSEGDTSSKSISLEYSKYFLDAAYNLCIYKGFAISNQYNITNQINDNDGLFLEKIDKEYSKFIYSSNYSLPDELKEKLISEDNLSYAFFICVEGNFVSPITSNSTLLISAAATTIATGGAMSVGIKPLSVFKISGVLMDLKNKQIIWNRQANYEFKDDEIDGLMFAYESIKSLFKKLPGKKIKNQKEIIE